MTKTEIYNRNVVSVLKKIPRGSQDSTINAKERDSKFTGQTRQPTSQCTDQQNRSTKNHDPEKTKNI